MLGRRNILYQQANFVLHARSEQSSTCRRSLLDECAPLSYKRRSSPSTRSLSTHRSSLSSLRVGDDKDERRLSNSSAHSLSIELFSLTVLMSHPRLFSTSSASSSSVQLDTDEDIACSLPGEIFIYTLILKMFFFLLIYRFLRENLESSHPGKVWLLLFELVLSSVIFDAVFRLSNKKITLSIRLKCFNSRWGWNWGQRPERRWKINDLTLSAVMIRALAGPRAVSDYIEWNTSRGRALVISLSPRLRRLTVVLLTGSRVAAGRKRIEINRRSIRRSFTDLRASKWLNLTERSNPEKSFVRRGLRNKYSFNSNTQIYVYIKSILIK